MRLNMSPLVRKSTICSKHMSRAMSMNIWLTLVGYWVGVLYGEPIIVHIWYGEVSCQYVHGVLVLISVNAVLR